MRLNIPNTKFGILLISHFVKFAMQYKTVNYKIYALMVYTQVAVNVKLASLVIRGLAG